jgi:hypothetical protein
MFQAKMPLSYQWQYGPKGATQKSSLQAFFIANLTSRLDLYYKNRPKMMQMIER